MAERKKIGRPEKFETDSARKKARVAYKAARYRIDIGPVSEEWIRRKEEMGMKTHADFAAFLLNRYILKLKFCLYALEHECRSFCLSADSDLDLY